MAFESEILLATTFVDEASAMDAITWMADYAQQENKKLVINQSWNLTFISTPDDSSLFHAFMDSYHDQGVYFTASAGNFSSHDCHIGYEFAGDTMRTWVQQNDSVFPGQQGPDIVVWGEAGHSFSLGFEVRLRSNMDSVVFNSSVFTTYQNTSSSVGAFTLNGEYYGYVIDIDSAHPLNHNPRFRLKFTRNAPSGMRYILKAAADEGKCHFYNVTGSTLNFLNWPAHFSSWNSSSTQGDREQNVAFPATPSSAIAVGSHKPGIFGGGNWFPQGIAPSSSKGLTLDGRQKPDITAPGWFPMTAINGYNDFGANPDDSVSFNGSSYYFWNNWDGTSYAAPVVAGVVALMLDANPALSFDQIKSILHETAMQDQFTTSNIPNPTWGYGKLHAWRAVLKAEQLVGIDQPSRFARDIILFPNPADEYIQMALPNEWQQQTFIILNMNGQIVKQTIPSSSGIIEISDLPKGVYVITLPNDDKARSARFVKM